MTYCLAWKKENSIFMIADSAISAQEDEVNANTNTFGEVQGLYGKYVVQEGQLKILKINEDMIVCFSGRVQLAHEIINVIHTYSKSESFEQLMRIIKNTYEGCNIEIVIAKLIKNGRNRIYYFNGDFFTEVDRIEIGNGKRLGNFSKDVNYIVDYFYKFGMDRNEYLSKILGVIQCYSYKNHTFSEGVGGCFTGVIMDTKIKWFRDLEYYFFDDDIKKCNTMSVIARENSVFSSTDFDGGIRYFINHLTDNNILEDLYFGHAISKSLNTKNAYYYFFYSTKYNVIAFLIVNGQTQNIHFRRWIRRDNGKTHYAYSFSEDFEKIFSNNDSRNYKLPSLVEVQVIKDRYVSHEEILQYCSPLDIENAGHNEEMDFDFNEAVNKGYDISLVQAIKNTIQEYHNLVLIDFSYFCDALSEIIPVCNQIDDFTIEKLNLDAIVNAFLKQIASEEFTRYRIVVIKSIRDNRIISGMNMKDFFLRYTNCLVIEKEEPIDIFCGTLFQLMKNFYLNDSFFHLDKFVIINDSVKVNNILMQIIPKFNLKAQNPDIILVRNLNGLTNMDGRIKYIVIDYLVIAMLGISYEEYYKAESFLDDSAVTEID